MFLSYICIGLFIWDKNTPTACRGIPPLKEGATCLPKLNLNFASLAKQIYVYSFLILVNPKPCLSFLTSMQTKIIFTVFWLPCKSNPCVPYLTRVQTKPITSSLNLVQFIPISTFLLFVKTIECGKMFMCRKAKRNIQQLSRLGPPCLRIL